MATSGTGFSYAQAAKGLAPSTQSNSTVPSSTTSEYGGKETAMPMETPAADKTRSSSHENVGAGTNDSNLEFNVVEPNRTKRDESPRTKNIVPPMISSNPSAETENMTTQNEGAITTTETGDQGRTTDISGQGSDTNKGSKDVDDDWEKVSIPSVAAEKELKAAPIPTVNIWQQRREAQDAKLKEVTTQKPTPNTTPPKPKVPIQIPVDESRRKQVTKENDKPGSTASRQTTFGTKTASDRKESIQTSPRSSTQQDSRTTPTLRPTADTESWPTPDTSTTTEDRRRSSIVEKGDRPDIKGGNQKKWVQMPFVPTAKFETQLPPAAARRGGRPANRGRDGGSRGGISSQYVPNGEKSEVGSMGPPPLPNKAFEHERGRKNTAPQGSRASSVPNQSSRAPSTDGHLRDGPRSSVAYAKTPIENTRSSEPFLPKSVTTNGEDSTLLDASRSSSRHTASQASARRPDAERRNSPQTTSGQGSSIVDNGSRFSSGERHRNSQYENNRGSVDHIDRTFQSSREWSRSRPDAGREKTDSWRGRGSQSDRSRGGYRGRGSHNSYSNHMSPTSYNPLGSANGSESSRSATFQEARNTRQASQPYSTAQSLTGNRGNNPRSQSIPVAMMQGGYYSPVQGFPQTLSPTDMNFGQYQQQVPGGIMSAMPYADQLNSFALISMVITQLEYYFSIDNLCKDMFLRKNMDSQGFVSLSVIANFKRIKALTDGQIDHDQLRTVCQQVRNVEFIAGEDGEDKLRSRENWRDFVLPIEERLPSAQKEGPAIRNPHALPQPAQGDYSNVNGTLRSSPGGINGYMEQFAQPAAPMDYPPIPPFDGSGDYGLGRLSSQPSDQVRRDSATSPFTNAQSPPTHDHARSPLFMMSNGHNPSFSTSDQNGNIFPDDKIPELKVVVRDPAYELPQHTDDSGQLSGAEALSLRGGAAAPEQLSQLQALQFGQTSASPGAHDTDQPPYWTKDGEIAQIPTGPGFVHEDYLPLREKALAQRLDKHLDGALRVLYAFWSSFLVEHFNLSMYEEFSTLAKEDLEAGSETGKAYLVTYYDTLLTGRTIISERIATDIVILARSETGERRPIWQKLRTAWRNGATNMKTRKRLGDALTAEEKTELDNVK